MPGIGGIPITEWRIYKVLQMAAYVARLVELGKPGPGRGAEKIADAIQAQREEERDMGLPETAELTEARALFFAALIRYANVLMRLWLARKSVS